MSLAELRTYRRHRLRPDVVRLVTRECPRPDWRWLVDDPAIVWSPTWSDVRALDLRPLHGLPVVALVDCVATRRSEVLDGLQAVGAQLAAISDGINTDVTEAHPWAKRLQELAGEDWQAELAPVIEADWNLFFDGGVNANPA